MRKFKKMIYLGNGERSQGEMLRLHERLEEGLSLLSGLQQGGAGVRGSAEFERAEADISDVVRDVRDALGSKLAKIAVRIHHGFVGAHWKLISKRGSWKVSPDPVSGAPLIEHNPDGPGFVAWIQLKEGSGWDSTRIAPTHAKDRASAALLCMMSRLVDLERDRAASTEARF